MAFKIMDLKMKVEEKGKNEKEMKQKKNLLSNEWGGKAKL